MITTVRIFYFLITAWIVNQHLITRRGFRGITLHHRMRQDKNPYSRQIKEFDERIRDALSNNIQLTDEEVDT